MLRVLAVFGIRLIMDRYHWEDGSLFLQAAFSYDKGTGALSLMLLSLSRKSAILSFQF